MIAAPERIRVNCDLRHVNVVLCCDPKAFTHTNPLDGMAEGGCLVWESDEEGEAAWERLPLWARKQIIDKKIRVFTLPGFKIAREGDRPRRPAAPHAGQRLSGRVLFGLADARGIRHHARAVPRRGPQAVREEVRQARRSGRGLEHGGHDQGLRAGARDQGGRDGSRRPLDAARQGAAADRDAREHRRQRRMRHGLPHDSASRGSAGTSAADARRRLRRDVPGEAWLQPAGQRVRVARHHGGRQRRHRVEIRRAPRDAALYS